MGHFRRNKPRESRAGVFQDGSSPRPSCRAQIVPLVWARLTIACIPARIGRLCGRGWSILGMPLYGAIGFMVFTMDTMSACPGTKRLIRRANSWTLRSVTFKGFRSDRHLRHDRLILVRRLRVWAHRKVVFGASDPNKSRRWRASSRTSTFPRGGPVLSHDCRWLWRSPFCWGFYPSRCRDMSGSTRFFAANRPTKLLPTACKCNCP